MLGKHTATCRLEGTGDCDNRVGQGRGRRRGGLGQGRARAGDRDCIMQADQQRPVPHESNKQETTRAITGGQTWLICMYTYLGIIEVFVI